RACWGGDTGGDNGLFDAGTYSGLHEAIDSMRDVYAHAYFAGRCVYVDILATDLRGKVTPHQAVIYCCGTGAWSPDSPVFAAAADHCLAAAYRGECPGIDPNALMRWRVET